MDRKGELQEERVKRRRGRWKSERDKGRLQEEEGASGIGYICCKGNWEEGKEMGW